MGAIYTAAVNPISTTLSSSPSLGGTSFTIASASGLPTIPSGSFGTARIIAEGANSSEDIQYTRSTTTITLANSAVLASAHASGATINFDVISSSFLDQFKDDAISGYPENDLTGAGALVLGTGVMNHITITSADATFTLANGTYKGQLCRIRMDVTCTKVAEIDPASTTTIDGVLKRYLWAGETCYLAWNGTEWNKVAGRTIPMAVMATRATNQTGIVSSTWTAIAMTAQNTAMVGPAAMWDSGNGRVKILRPSNVQIGVYANGSGASAAVQCFAGIGINGTGPGANYTDLFAPFGCSFASGGWVGQYHTSGIVAKDDYLQPFVNAPAVTTLTCSGGSIIVAEVPSW